MCLRPSCEPQPLTPALYLYPFNDSFVPTHVILLPQQRIEVGRQTLVAGRTPIQLQGAAVGSKRFHATQPRELVGTDDIAITTWISFSAN